MSTLAAGLSETVALAIGQRLTVVAATGASGTIARLGDTPGEAHGAVTAIATAETKRFGPFSAPARFEVTCLIGSFTVTQAVPDADAQVGTIDADNAVAGDVGELLTATLAVGSPVSLATGTAKTALSIALTPGDWDVDAVLGVIPAATTSITNLAGGLHTTTDTLGAAGTYFQRASAAVVPGAVEQHNPVPTQRFNVSVATTVYLVAKGTFTVDTLGAFGSIRARRVR